MGVYLSALKLNYKKPTHTTLLNWIHKIGYHELNKKKEKANDWIIILDESIQLGQDKILLIYGIREEKIDFTRPLQFQDLLPLREISKTKWTGEIIRDVILDLQNELSGIKYAVGDYGSQIKKALKLSHILHIHDLTHKIALILEKKFQKFSLYSDLIDNMSDMRMKYAQTKIAYLIPPKQRKKSRYQNIKIISDWCEKTLNLIQSNRQIDPDVYDKLKWLLNYQGFIRDLSVLNKTINQIEKTLKYKGLSAKSKIECYKILSKLHSEMGIYFRNEFIKYIKDMESICPTDEKVLITSDIIESAFGKYKNYISLNPMAGVTNLILCLSAFTASLSEKNIKTALENTTINDIKVWTQKFVGKTLLQKRKEAFCFS